MERVAWLGHLKTLVSGDDHDDDAKKQQLLLKLQRPQTENLESNDLVDVQFLHGRTHSIGTTIAIRRRKDPSVQLSREKADPESWLDSKPGTVYNARTVVFTDPGPLGLKFEHGTHLDSTDHHPAIKDIASHLPDAVNQFRRGDLLMEVNGVDTIGISPEQLGHFLRKRPLTLTVLQQPLEISSSLLFPKRHFVPPPEFVGFPEFSYENLELPRHEGHVGNLGSTWTTSTETNELKSAWDSSLFHRSKEKFARTWTGCAFGPVGRPQQQVRSWTSDGARNVQYGTDSDGTTGCLRTDSTFPRESTAGYRDDMFSRDDAQHPAPAETIGKALTNIFSRSDYFDRPSSPHPGSLRNVITAPAKSSGVALTDEFSPTFPALPYRCRSADRNVPSRSESRIKTTTTDGFYSTTSFGDAESADGGAHALLRIAENFEGAVPAESSMAERMYIARREADLAKRQVVWSQASSIWNDRARQGFHTAHIQLI
eukprot:GEMP01047974.1.p1 GENE.GEMP01047974.1~~GEMP01047974.1.p1  ORF type:complete len:484 (+),score=69.29 GEMP01047974.1:172-1623(+)